ADAAERHGHAARARERFGLSDECAFDAERFDIGAVREGEAVEKAAASGLHFAFDGAQACFVARIREDTQLWSGQVKIGRGLQVCARVTQAPAQIFALLFGEAGALGVSDVGRAVRVDTPLRLTRFAGV